MTETNHSSDQQGSNQTNPRTIALSSVPAGMVVYMLETGSMYERSTNGPYLGAPGLDFAALATTYRDLRYSMAEAAREDYCYVGDSEFIAWLLSTGHLFHLAVTQDTIEIPDREYIPSHWPTCPSCNEGKGEKSYGETRRSLNRVMAFHRCSACHHEWGHHEEAAYGDRPMLEDDGRDKAGACVPFAISKACALDFATVLKVCTDHGWTTDGLDQSQAILAARQLGFNLIRCPRPEFGTRRAPTIKRVVAALDPDRNYVIGIHRHWLAVVGGVVTDNDSNSGMGCKVVELYEVRPALAIAA